MGETNLHELFERWQVAGLKPARPDEVKQLLETEYKAYEIPLYSNAREDYANDEEVRDDLLDSLYTITHRDVLDRIRTEVDREMIDLDADWADSYWHDLFREDPDVEGDQLANNLLTTQHALGQRVSVVLEREDGYITGFKVYGPAQLLTDRLLTLIGYPLKRPGDHEGGPWVSRRDLSDPLFVSYLEHLGRAGAL